MVFWIQEVTAWRPLKELLIQGEKITGLLDTGADVSCIAGKDWPSEWPTKAAPIGLIGIGRAPSIAKSTQILPWANEEGQSGVFCPCGIPTIPITLWGRDILSHMGMLLYSPDDKVPAQMLQMHFDPDKGLGKHNQDIKEPIQTISNVKRQGLGYQNF